LTAALLLAIGVVKVINLLVLLAYVMIALWALNALLAGRRLRHLSVKRFLPRAIFAGKPFELVVRVRNCARGPVAGVVVSSGSTTKGRWFLPRLAPGHTVSLQHRAILQRRGRATWAASYAWSGYPFGLARRRLAVVGTEQIIVFPSVGKLHRGRLQQRLRQEATALGRSQQPPRRHPTAQSEFHGLRAFRSGDSPRWIHWRTSARCGELMVREFEDRPNEDLVLVVDLARPALPSGTDRTDEPYQSGQRLVEEAVSLAATICLEWCRQQGDRIVLAVAGSEPVVVQGFTSESEAIRMLEALALQEGRGESSDFSPLIALLTPGALPAVPVLLVRTRETGLEAALAKTLVRPVVCLDVPQCASFDFYERPANHGT
jgi:uncharacterized protein (DUF58 family)